MEEPIEKIEHVCEKCGDSFRDAHNLRRHLKRKKPCIPDKVPIISNTDVNKCIYCGSTFASAYSLRRHKNSCKVAQNPAQLLQYMIERDIQRDKIDQQRSEREQKLLEILEKNGLASTVNNTMNVMNVTNNVQQNIYMNVVLCPFGKEDLSKLDKTKVMQLLKDHEADFMSRMIDYMHTDPSLPEFHNLFYDRPSDMAVVFAAISETEKSWLPRKFPEVAEEIIDAVIEHVRPGGGPYYDTAGQAKDYDACNSIIRIAKHTKWDTPEALEMHKTVLSKLTKDKNFMDMVTMPE